MRGNRSILLLLLLVVACGKKQDSSDEEKQVSAVVPVRAAQVIVGNVPEQLTVTGHTEATEREKITAPIAGRLLALNGLEGMHVEAGELLATIQSKEAESSQAGAQLMLQQAKTPAERAQAERMVSLAKKDQNGVEVRAKISGLIASRSANPGEFVSEDEELLSIIAEGDIVFVADVPLFQMPQVRIGEAATVTLPTLGANGGSIPATVFTIKPQADSSSQSARVVFQFRNRSPFLVRALRTGIAGTATITFDVRHHAMLVPKSAVLRNDETNEEIVMTFGADSIAHSVTVVSGPEIDSLISVQSDDLKPGMNVITEGNYSLADSTRITLNEAYGSRDEKSAGNAGSQGNGSNGSSTSTSSSSSGQTPGAPQNSQPSTPSTPTSGAPSQQNPNAAMQKAGNRNIAPGAASSTVAPSTVAPSRAPGNTPAPPNSSPNAGGGTPGQTPAGSGK